MPNTKHITVDQVIEVLADLQTKADGRFRAIATAIFEADLDASLVAKINGKASQSDLQSLEDIVSDLSGEDGGKSARVIASEEVAKVVAGAPASYDTLKELADWIMNDTTGAAKMANDVSALKTKTTLGTHEVGGETVEYDTVQDYVEAYVADAVGTSYTAGNGIDINDGDISIKLGSSDTNGLNYDSDGALILDLADEYNAGAMSPSDKTAISDLQSDVSDLETDVETLNGKTSIDDAYPSSSEAFSGIGWDGSHFYIYPDESYDRAIKFNDGNGSVYINTLYAPGEDETPAGTFDTSVGAITYGDFMKFHGKQEFINSSDSITVGDTDTSGMNPYFEADLKVDANNANGLNVTSSGVGISLASNSAAGAMSAADKAKLDAAETATAVDIAAIKATIWPSA